MTTSSFDWLSDLQPLFDAHEAWLDGTYQKVQTRQLLCSPKFPFTISCGSGLLAEHIRRFRFTPQLIQRLGQVTDEKGRSRFQESFLNHLQRLRLRVQVQAAPEGTLLVPGEPILIAQGPKLQILLLGSAFRWLFWESSNWATQSALSFWNKPEHEEEEVPPPPVFPYGPEGWKTRAEYIGGGHQVLAVDQPEWPGLEQINHPEGGNLIQIRRLFRGEAPLGDAWFTTVLEEDAGVARHHLDMVDLKTGKRFSFEMTRFQNLYQPVLLKGHPVMAEPSLGYLRQRLWKQLESFRKIDLGTYPSGWAEMLHDRHLPITE